MPKQFDAAWLEWIEGNIERGCCKDQLYRTLLKNGFDARQSAVKLGISGGVEQSSDPGQAVAAGHSGGVGISPMPGKVSQRTLSPTDKGLYLPTAVKVDCTGAQVYGIDNFLSTHECMRLIELIKKNQRRSTTTSETDRISDFRTSQTCDLGLLNDEFVQEIDQRICRLMGVSSGNSESIQGQWYDIGNEFKPHTDYFNPGTDATININADEIIGTVSIDGVETEIQVQREVDGNGNFTGGFVPASQQNADNLSAMTGADIDTDTTLDTAASMSTDSGSESTDNGSEPDTGVANVAVTGSNITGPTGTATLVENGVDMGEQVFVQMDQNGNVVDVSREPDFDEPTTGTEPLDSGSSSAAVETDLLDSTPTEVDNRLHGSSPLECYNPAPAIAGKTKELHCEYRA